MSFTLSCASATSSWDFELGQSRGYRPAQKPSPLLVFGELGHAVVGEELRGEFAVLGGNRGLELLLELIRIELTHALVLLGDDGVDGVGLVADTLVDPSQLDLELLRRESHRAKHPHSPGLADGHHDVAAVGEREDRDIDPEKVTNLGSHDGDSRSEARPVLARRHAPRGARDPGPSAACLSR